MKKRLSCPFPGLRAFLLSRYCAFRTTARGGLFVCFSLMSGIACFGQGLVVTPNPASVRQGESLTFKSNQPVTWSLANGSSGNLIVNSTTSATYTAPNVILPQGVSAGCQTTPSDSVFNTRIDNLPVEANSASWIAIMNPKASAFNPILGQTSWMPRRRW